MTAATDMADTKLDQTRHTLSPHQPARRTAEGGGWRARDLNTELASFPIFEGVLGVLGHRAPGD
jgi:hypothetical protein